MTSTIESCSSVLKISQPNVRLETKILSELPILSWNIHDTVMSEEGLKTNDSDFVEILQQSLIFCLQETKQDFSLPNYECFNSLRADSRSGGICIGVHRSLTSNVKLLRTGCSDFQAMTVFPQDDSRKFTIINVYDSPEQSSYKARRKGLAEPSTLDLLFEFRAKTPNLGETLLVGDLNARTADKNTTPEELSDEYGPEVSYPISFPESDERISKDQTHNSRGALFLDFLACNNLQILNGCTLGDIFGDFTSVNYNGSSVVDYFAATPNTRERVSSFQILELTKFSDHKPCFCKLKCKSVISDAEALTETLEDAPQKYKWNGAENEANRHRYIAVQNTPQFADQIESIIATECYNKEDVIRLSQGIVKILNDVAVKVTPNNNTKQNRKKRQKYRGKKARMKPKAPWFDAACINSKRELNRLAKSYGKNPASQYLRNSYYEKRRLHRKLIKLKKSSFFKELCSDIESGDNINWARFKKLKELKTEGSKLDVFDMLNFCKFFKDLYGKPSINETRIEQLQNGMTRSNLQSELSESLDQNITHGELLGCINSLKRGKAVSEDCVLNEFLKSSNMKMQSAILHLFNQCLSFGVYPWSTSVVTPLHKKGSLYDPNNYRAIAVASNIGKLFSSILLQRLISFRNLACPDTSNQLGFCKGAQTADHMLTLSTCVEKYISKKKERVYACFVDYAKAFDTVCREALLYKIWHLGIQGRFFSCLKHMYTNSSAKIKLLNKLSERIDVLCGTEQGHPLSPELFKIFIHQLSEDLNELEEVEVPIINSTRVTHLLWADDLILLALNSTSLQKMLNTLESYCLEWGLTVNISKTAIMVFNRAGRILKESKNFTYGQISISSVREYTYLGITFTLTGSLKLAQVKLKQKAIRSYFSLKSMIDLQSIKKTVIFKLFDALVLPIASYGCQIWLPQTKFTTAFYSRNKFPNLKEIAEDQIEKVHLSFLKWTIGVGKRTSNAGVWGDTGRYPLAIEASPQVFNYVRRLESMEISGSEALVRHAFTEQKKMGLSWYSGITSMNQFLAETNERQQSPFQKRDVLRSCFRTQWDEERQLNRKLGFYNSIKSSFGCEKYLSLYLPYKQSKRLAQIRTSSHRLNIETGRHGHFRRNNILNRICPTCSTKEKNTLEYMAELPFFDPIIEDEVHVPRTCPLYQDSRDRLSSEAKTNLFEGMDLIFTQPKLLKEIAKFLVDIDALRFPRDVA